METQYFKHYSPALNKEMECKVYGHAGRPVLFIPCQDGRFFSFEDFKMTDVWAPWIESGQVMVFAIWKPGLTSGAMPNGALNATNNGFIILPRKWFHSCVTW